MSDAELRPWIGPREHHQVACRPRHLVAEKGGRVIHEASIEQRPSVDDHHRGERRRGTGRQHQIGQRLARATGARVDRHRGEPQRAPKPGVDLCREKRLLGRVPEQPDRRGNRTGEEPWKGRGQHPDRERGRLDALQPTSIEHVHGRRPVHAPVRRHGLAAEQIQEADVLRRSLAGLDPEVPALLPSLRDVHQQDVGASRARRDARGARQEPVPPLLEEAELVERPVAAPREGEGEVALGHRRLTAGAARSLRCHGAMGRSRSKSVAGVTRAKATAPSRATCSIRRLSGTPFTSTSSRT